jgi:hypothetical protein
MYLSNLLLILVALITHVSASPLAYSALVARDTAQTQYNRTTTCLSSSFGGCCSIDQYGLYTGCMSSSLSPLSPFYNLPSLTPSLHTQAKTLLSPLQTYPGPVCPLPKQPIHGLVSTRERMARSKLLDVVVGRGVGFVFLSSLSHHIDLTPKPTCSPSSPPHNPKHTKNLD